MLVSINREALLAGLKIVAPAIASTNSALPVLSHVKIEVSETQMILSGNRLELALETAVTIDTSTVTPEVGAVLLPHKLLVDLLNEMTDELVALSSEPISTQVEIASGDGHIRLECLEADGFAMTPVILTEQSVQASVDSEWFADMCKRLIFAAATDDTRPVLNGVKFQVVDGQLEAATTDGFRLTRWQEVVEWGDVKVNIPSKPLVDILSVMQPTQLTFNCEVMRFEDAHTVATLNLIGGNYPDYSPIVAMKSTACVMRFPQAVLKQSILLSDVIARGERHHAVSLKFSDNEVQIGATYSEWGENVAVCPVEIVAGQPRTLWVNAKYLGDVVAHAPGDFVDIVTQLGEGSPIHLRAVGEDRWLAVVMPMAAPRK